MAINVVSTRAKSSAKALLPTPNYFLTAPEVIGSTLRWYKPHEGLVTDSNGGVSVLNDFSGLGFNAHDNIVSTRPTVAPNGAVNFSAPFRELLMPSVTLDPMKGYSIFFVGEVTGDCTVMGSNTSTTRFRIGQQGLHTLSLYDPALANPSTPDLGHTPTIGLYGARVSIGLVHFLFNRVESVQNASQTVLHFNTINNGYTTGSFLMHELLLVDKYVSNTELAALITYFNTTHNMGI